MSGRRTIPWSSRRLASRDLDANSVRGLWSAQELVREASRQTTKSRFPLLWAAVALTVISLQGCPTGRLPPSPCVPNACWSTPSPTMSSWSAPVAMKFGSAPGVRSTTWRTWRRDIRWCRAASSRREPTTRRRARTFLSGAISNTIAIRYLVSNRCQPVHATSHRRRTPSCEGARAAPGHRSVGRADAKGGYSKGKQCISGAPWWRAIACLGGHISDS